jgi:hypothetical protein
MVVGMKENFVEQSAYSKQCTDWMEKTGGYRTICHTTKEGQKIVAKEIYGDMPPLNSYFSNEYKEEQRIKNIRATKMLDIILTKERAQ